jgi:chagasin family peptidase inhibitor I42
MVMSKAALVAAAVLSIGPGVAARPGSPIPRSPVLGWPAMADATELTVKTGAEVRITLPGHGSSGRVWSYSVEGDSGAIAVTRESGRGPDLPPPGGLPPPSYSLDEIVIVRGVHAGTAILRLTLARPNGRGTAPAEQRRITVRVLPAD